MMCFCTYPELSVFKGTSIDPWNESLSHIFVWKQTRSSISQRLYVSNALAACSDVQWITVNVRSPISRGYVNLTRTTTTTSSESTSISSVSIWDLIPVSFRAERGHLLWSYFYLFLFYFRSTIPVSYSNVKVILSQIFKSEEKSFFSEKGVDRGIISHTRTIIHAVITSRSARIYPYLLSRAYDIQNRGFLFHKKKTSIWDDRLDQLWSVTEILHVEIILGQKTWRVQATCRPTSKRKHETSSRFVNNSRQDVPSAWDCRD